MVLEHKPRRAREYLRVSKDKSGVQRSIDEQHGENAEAAADEGFTLGEPYIDNDRSASRHARKRREGFDKLIGDLEHDRFAAEILQLWESSRGSRRVGEWVTLIELCEERTVLIYVTTHGRLYDPKVPRDRKSLIDDASDSEYEAAKLSIRSKRNAAASAREGRPYGGTPVGFARRYWVERDPETGKSRKVMAQEVDPDAAPLIEELFTRFVAGHALQAISRDWLQRGILNDSGTPYSPQHLRMLLLNPAYAGLRMHDPTRKAARSALAQSSTAMVKAIWPAIVDMPTFLAAREILADPTRKTSRPGRGKWWLSMIGRCDVCSGPIAVRFPSDRPGTGVYWCRLGHVRINRTDLEEYVEDVVLDWLDKPDVHEMFAKVEDTGVELVAARKAVAVVRAELKELERDFGAGRVKSTFALAAEAEKNRRLEAAEAREQELLMPSRLAGLIGLGPGLRKRWKAMPMSARREVARIILAPDLIGELRIARAGYRGEPVEDRVRWRRDSPEEL